MMAVNLRSVLLLFYTLAALKLAESKTLAGTHGCYVELDKLPNDTKIFKGMTRNSKEVRALPDDFNWSDQVDLSPTTNQFLPSLCGSCWAHAAVGALTDRIIITRRKLGNHTPVVPLSPQVLLDCKDETLGTCNGGSALGAYAFIKKNGITDITCSPYFGADEVFWGEQDSCAERMCRQCDRFGSCKFVDSPKQYISEYGLVHGEDEMKNEIYNNGPIACSLYAHSNSFEDYKEGIIRDSTVYNFTTHVVAITGWGVSSDGTQYWWGRNSFGSTWGLQGWFQLQRGVNALDIENHTCAWAVPQL